MATNSTYYLDAADLATATAVYLDSSLAFLAPDGFYGDGTISRQQSLGILLPAETCVSPCPVPCGGSIGASGGQGIYLANLDTGSDVGAIVIYFNPDNVPDGIRAVYDGNTYNKLSSPIDGRHESTNPTGFTVVGNSGSDCGLAGNTTNFPAAIEYLYNGTSFLPTGNTQNITISPGDVSLGASPGSCIMVIPKTTASPSVINLEMFGPCSGTVWAASIQCPYLLPSFDSSVGYTFANLGCFFPITETYYFAKVHTGSDGFVGLYDYVFEDAYGAMPLAEGFYLINNVASPNKVIEVKFGIVVGITNCIAVDCFEYVLTTNETSQQLVFYYDCDNLDQSVFVSNTSPVNICAKFGTIDAPTTVTVTIVSPCTP
jgi:hypothetical protein